MSMPPTEERKLVTVLFADLAGSTQLAVGRDPEQLRALLAAFFDEMAQHVRAYGGTVEKYAGDAIMAVFGVPAVHEDDAERAVRAAVAMREGLAQLNTAFEDEFGARLDLRVGIATGEAVAATDDARELLVTGEVANLAARLQTVVPGIVVSQETHRLLEPLLEAERLDAVVVKGFPLPVVAYRVATVRGGGGPRGIPGLSSPVVGRDQELARLRQATEELQRGRGQVVSIVGEAGLGKSRLKNELREHLPEGLRWLEGRCQAYLQTTSYAPFIQILRALFRLTGGEPETVARIRLRATLRPLVGDRHEQVQPVVAALLGIPIEVTDATALPADPRALQSHLLLAIRAIVEGLAGRAPVVLAIEDIHWADTGSIEILTLLMELTDLQPLMILVTSRPEIEGRSWDLRFHAQRNYPHRLDEIQLSALAPDSAERLVENLLHISELPDTLRARIRERAEGNPFYIEEIIRALIEQQVLRREGDRWIVLGGGGSIPLPNTLRGVIAARIDRLPADAKRVLQRAAVVGRFFTARVLRAIGDPDDGALDRALAHLLRAELIREWARLPEAEYLFKHALTQEAAYASLLAEQRRALHRRVAASLEQTAAAGEGQPGLLARHWLLAEEWEPALRYTLQAAERAGKLYVRPEAIGHYWQALELLDRLPRTPERRRTHLEVVLALLDLPGWMRGPADIDRGREHLESAIREATEARDTASRPRLESLKGALIEDEGLLTSALAGAEASKDARVWAEVAWRYAELLGRRGRYEEALAYVPRAIEILGELGERSEQAGWMAYTGRCYCSRAGRLDDAFRYAASAREVATAIADPRLLAWRAMEAETYLYRGLWAEVVAVVEAGLSTSWEIGEWPAILFPSAWVGIAYTKLGRLEDARRVIGRALREGRARGYPPYPLTYLHLALAQLHLAANELDEALATARAALDLAERSRFRLEIGAAHRVLAQVRATLGDQAEAARAFSSSLEILEEIQSRPELGQTLLAYGRFLARSDALTGRALIERALGLFEDMGATGWIAEARAALTA
jgi:class 3 adenylate cyclase/tetratricopeptide (TPR) repeat protein